MILNKWSGSLCQKYLVISTFDDYWRAFLPVGGCSKDQIVEDGRVGGDPDAAAHHDRHLELVPVLIAAAEGSLNANLEQTKSFKIVNEI